MSKDKKKGPPPQDGYGTVDGVVEHVAEDALMLVSTLPPERRHPVMGALGSMLAATRHARIALTANGEPPDPELDALCEQVARMVIGQVAARPDDIPPAFRAAFEDKT